MVPENGLKVSVYWNLHKKTFSVSHKNKVIWHGSHFQLHKAQFVVRPAGRSKVLEEMRKNVHAFVKGEFCLRGHTFDCSRYVKYDPYEKDHFFDFYSGERVDKAKAVYLTITNEGKPRLLATYT